MSEADPAINALISRYVETKRGLGEQLGASEALLHVHVGLLIFVVTALLLRRRMASVWPLAVVATLALVNEVIDWFGPSPAPLSRAVSDIINSVFWPLVLFLLARRGVVRTKI